MDLRLLFLAASLFAAPALAAPFSLNLKNPTKLSPSAASAQLRASAAKSVNDELLAESRKNQCSFKVDSDVLEPGCDEKAKNLANAIVSAKRSLDASQMRNYKFVVYGHTDTTGNAAHNKELSRKRAEAIVKQLVARGISRTEIQAVGMGAEKPLVKPDDTPAKKAKNRRYELQVRL